MMRFRRTSYNSARSEPSPAFERFKQSIEEAQELYHKTMGGEASVMIAFVKQMKSLEALYGAHSGTAMNEHLQTIHTVFSEQYGNLQCYLSALKKVLLLRVSNTDGKRKQSAVPVDPLSSHLAKRKQAVPVRSEEHPVVGRSLVFSNSHTHWLRFYGEQDEMSEQENLSAAALSSTASHCSP